MGVIRNQSIKSAIIIYIGFAIGALNTLFLMTRFLTNDQMGVVSLFLALAMQIVTTGSFGIFVIINKFQPYYVAHLEPPKRDLMSVTLFIGLLGMILMLGISYLGQDIIIRKFSKNSSLFIDHLYLLPVFAMGYFFYYLFDTFNNNYKFTVWGTVVRELFQKLFNVLCVVLFALGAVNLSGFICIYSAMYWIAAILILLNLKKQHLLFVPLRLSKLTKRLKVKMLHYSIPSWGIQILGVSAQFVDTVAIASLCGLGYTAIYTVAKMIISPIILPSSAIMNISIPFISDAWRRNDLAKIDEIYKKSALVLVLACGFIFFMLWANIDDLLNLIPSSFYFNSADVVNQAKYVILILGIARMCDFATSVNAHILQNSRKYFLIDMYANIFTIALMIPTTYFFIKTFGMIGSGYSYLTIALITNTFKAIFLYKKERLHPFTLKWLPMLAIFSFAIFLNYGFNFLVQDISFFTEKSILYQIIRIAIRSSLLFAIIVPLIYKLKISDDVNVIIDGALKRLPIKLTK